MPRTEKITTCGHEPHCAKGLCRKCYVRKYDIENAERNREKRRKNYLKNLKKRRAYSRKYHADNREKRKEAFREWRLRNIDNGRHRQLVRKFGISLEQRNAMWWERAGKCDLCGGMMRPFGQKEDSTHVDHCHITNRVRGLLHSRCNKALAWIENVEFRKQAEAYLKRVANKLAHPEIFGYIVPPIPRDTPAQDMAAE